MAAASLCNGPKPLNWVAYTLTFGNWRAMASVPSEEPESSTTTSSNERTESSTLGKCLALFLVRMVMLIITDAWVRITRNQCNRSDVLEYQWWIICRRLLFVKPNALPVRQMERGSSGNQFVVLFVETEAKPFFQLEHQAVFFFARTESVIRVGPENSFCLRQPIPHHFGMRAGEKFEYRRINVRVIHRAAGLSSQYLCVAEVLRFICASLRTQP